MHGKAGKKRTIFECARLRALSVPGPGPAQLKELLQRPLLAGVPGRAVLKRPEPGAVKKTDIGGGHALNTESQQRPFPPSHNGMNGLSRYAHFNMRTPRTPSGQPITPTRISADKSILTMPFRRFPHVTRCLRRFGDRRYGAVPAARAAHSKSFASRLLLMGVHRRPGN